MIVSRSWLAGWRTEYVLVLPLVEHVVPAETTSRWRSLS